MKEEEEDNDEDKEDEEVEHLIVPTCLGTNSVVFPDPSLLFLLHNT